MGHRRSPLRAAGVGHQARCAPWPCRIYNCSLYCQEGGVRVLLKLEYAITADPFRALRVHSDPTPPPSPRKQSSRRFERDGVRGRVDDTVRHADGAAGAGTWHLRNERCTNRAQDRQRTDPQKIAQNHRGKGQSGHTHGGVRVEHAAQAKVRSRSRLRALASQSLAKGYHRAKFTALHRIRCDAIVAIHKCLNDSGCIGTCIISLPVRNRHPS